MKGFQLEPLSSRAVLCVLDALKIYFDNFIGIFSVDLSGIQLPKFSLPLNFDHLFQPNHQAHTAAHRRHHDRRSFLPQIFSTQIPPPTYRSYDGGPDVYSSERSQEFPDELNTIDMETQMKVLDSELVTNMKNQKYSPQSSTPAPVDNNETFTKPQNGSIFPDLGVLKQLFQWGGQSAKSFAICHACKVGAGLFMLRVRFPLTSVANFTSVPIKASGAVI